MIRATDDPADKEAAKTAANYHIIVHYFFSIAQPYKQVTINIK